MKRALTIVVALVALTGCTRSQISAWLAWHQTDPDAAIEFAQRPDIVEALAQATSSDGPQFEQQLAADAVVPGDCSSYGPLFAAYSLPVATFQRIAWRESGCNHRSFVSDSDDLGGGLMGLNLKGSLAATWRGWCGLTTGNVTDAETNVRCAAAAYQRLGLQPWQ